MGSELVPIVMVLLCPFGWERATEVVWGVLVGSGGRKGECCPVCLANPCYHAAAFNVLG